MKNASENHAPASTTGATQNKSVSTFRFCALHTEPVELLNISINPKTCTTAHHRSGEEFSVTPKRYAPPGTDAALYRGLVLTSTSKKAIFYSCSICTTPLYINEYGDIYRGALIRGYIGRRAGSPRCRRCGGAR